MSVTVIIVNWNGGDLLLRCLQHLQTQSLLPQRILVMDNGSTDNSAVEASRLPGVTVRFLGKNLGFAAANNIALRECDCDWVALLNPDALPDQNWLLNLMNAAQCYPHISAFGSTQLLLDAPDKLDGIGDVYHISGLAWRNGHGKQRSELTNAKQNIFSPCACAALYRLNVLHQSGGFDEDYFCYMEDVDLGFRLRLQNQEALHVPDAIVYHAGSASSGGQHSNFAVYHGHRNLVWTFIKNMPGPLFWIFLPLHVLLNIISLVYFSIRGQARVILAAKRDAVLGIPKMWRKRRAIQAGRRTSLIQIWRIMDKRLFISK